MALSTLVLPALLIRWTWSYGTLVMMSASPESNKATRAAGSGVGLKVTVSKSGAPPQYSLLASRDRWSDLTHSLNLTTPDPTGFRLKASGPTELKYFIGRMWAP